MGSWGCAGGEGWSPYPNLPATANHCGVSSRSRSSGDALDRACHHFPRGCLLCLPFPEAAHTMPGLGAMELVVAVVVADEAEEEDEDEAAER